MPMITFTSEMAGLRETPVQPSACPRCEHAGPLEVSMRTERVVFYRCPECGHMWIVKTTQAVA